MPRRPGYQDALSLTVSLCLVYILCVAGVRVWIRKGSFGVDDVVIGVATIVTLCHYATSYVGLAQGLGMPWSSINNSGRVAVLNEASVGGIVTFLFALYLSKCAMIFFLSRITKTPRQLRLFLACNVLTAVIGVASILLVTLGCPTESGYYWAMYENSRSCPSQSARWQAITGLDIITEVLLLALPVYLVWGLQMPRRKKTMIIAAFYLRLPVIGFSLGRNYYALQLRLPQTDPGLEGALVVIWLGVELAYALAANTLSALKGFTESFNSDFGLGFTRGKGDGNYGLSHVSGGSGQSSKAEKSSDSAAILSSAGASRMGSVTPAGATKAGPKAGPQAAPSSSPATPTEDIARHPLKLRPDNELRSITCVTADPTPPEQRPRRRPSSASSRYSSPGDDMVILRETAYEVQHDEAPMLPPVARYA
ncbi:hypothetical protein LTR29_014928 [Friedmanniomyces endolithicus]|nr:hypothetical protein LTR29_014928 [Friedmanniomyces endolithicus]